jgi:hypothetical protein
MGLPPKVLSRDEKEDIALVGIMQQRRHEKTLPIETTYEILNK